MQPLQSGVCQVPQIFQANLISGFNATIFSLMEQAFVEIFKRFDFQAIKKIQVKFLVYAYNIAHRFFKWSASPCLIPLHHQSKVKGPFYLTNVMHLAPKHVKETFFKKLIQKFTHTTKNKSASMVMQPTNISPLMLHLKMEVWS